MSDRSPEFEDSADNPAEKIQELIHDRLELTDEIDRLRRGLREIGKSVNVIEEGVAEQSTVIFSEVLKNLKSTLKYFDEKLVSGWWEAHENRKQYNRMENTLKGNFLLLGEMDVQTYVLQHGSKDDPAPTPANISVTDKFLPPLTRGELKKIREFGEQFSTHRSSSRFYIRRLKNDLDIIRLEYDHLSPSLSSYVIDHTIYRHLQVIEMVELFKYFSLDDILSTIIDSLNSAMEENQNRIPLLRKKLEHLDMVSKMLKLK